MSTPITTVSNLYIGIEIHKRSWKVHFSIDLFIGKSFSMSLAPEQLLKYVSRYFSAYHVNVAYEAGCCGYYAHHCFEGYGWCSLVVNPAYIHRKRKEKHTKTDRVDAQLISRELKDGRLDSIVVSDVKQEEFRSLFRRRNDLVKDFLRIKSSIKMQLLYFGIKESEEFDNNHWSHKYRHWLDDMVFKYPTAKATLESRSMIGFSDL